MSSPEFSFNPTAAQEQRAPQEALLQQCLTEKIDGRIKDGPKA